jgi:peptidoglycan/LPS O-acetylase OafA/YrhL
VLQWFGLISYGLYLWHVLILRFGVHAIPGAAASIAIAAASYYAIERRFLKPR